MDVLFVGGPWSRRLVPDPDLPTWDVLEENKGLCLVSDNILPEPTKKHTYYRMTYILLNLDIGDGRGISEWPVAYIHESLRKKAETGKPFRVPELA